MRKLFLVFFSILSLDLIAQTRDNNFGNLGSSFINLFNLGCQVDMINDFDIDAQGNLYMIAKRAYHLSISDEDDILFKINSRGQLDSSFYENGFRAIGHGTVNFSYPSSFEEHVPEFVRVSNDQTRLWIVSSEPNRIVTAKFLTNGHLDSSYGKKGYKEIPSQMVFRDAVASIDNGIFLIGFEYLGGIPNLTIIKLDQNGNLDPAYHLTGKFSLPVPGKFTYRHSTLLSSDALLITSNYNITGKLNEDSITLLKITPSGRLDSTFARNGMARNFLNDAYGEANAHYRTRLLRDSSIVVVSTSDYGPLKTFKFTPSGYRDTVFHINGVKSHRIFGSNTSIFLGRDKNPQDLNLWMKKNYNYSADSARYVLLRLKEDGSLDSSFYRTPSVNPNQAGNDGYASFNAFPLAYNGQLIGISTVRSLLNNSFIRVSKLNQEGTYDNNYGGNGKPAVQIKSSLEQLISLQPLSDGRYIGLASNTSELLLFRVSTNGLLDTSFGSGGTVSLGREFEAFVNNFSKFGNGHLAVDGKNRILVYKSNRIARFTTNGMVDSSFGNNGQVALTYRAPEFYFRFMKAEMQKDNKIVVLYHTELNSPRVKEIGVLRLLENGKTDSSFGQNGRLTLDMDLEFGVIDGSGISAVYDFPQNILVLEDSSLIVSTTYVDASKHYMFKLDRNGTLLRNVGDSGRVIIEGNWESDNLFLGETVNGKIMSVQFSEINRSTTVTRLNRDLTADASYRSSRFYENDLDQSYLINSAHMLHSGKLILAGVYGEGVKRKLFHLAIKPQGGIDSSYGTNGLLFFTDQLPDTATITSPYRTDVSPSFSRALVIRDREGHLVTGTTVKKNNLGDIFLTRHLTYDTLVPSAPHTPFIEVSKGSVPCDGDSLELTAKVNNCVSCTFLWNNGAISRSIKVKQAGTYTVAVTNSLGSASASRTIVFNPPPPTPVITATGNTLTSSAGSGYRWYFNGVEMTWAASMRSITAHNPGQYTVSVSANGCTAYSPPFNFALTGIVNPQAWNYEVAGFPNPLAKKLFIKNTGGRRLLVRLINTTGSTVWQGSFFSSLYEINVQHLLSGTYLLLITDVKKDETISQGMIKL